MGTMPRLSARSTQYDWQPIHTTKPPLHCLHPLPMGGSASLWNGKLARAASAVAPMQKGTVS